MLARIDVHLANARKIQSARLALDAADQFLVATDREGEILWFTPQAYRLLEERFGGDDADRLRLPEEILGWLRARVSNTRTAVTGDETIFRKNGLQSRIRFVGGAERGEILFRISDAQPEVPLAAVRARFNLTQRETEVLSWIVQGKSNRDIASILTLSPRTIDKHLELIFVKLNVENRTAAAALILGFMRG